MLDIETLGNNSNSVIISIGAVFFDKNGIGSKFYQKVNAQSCLDIGLEMDVSTILWWIQQSENARKEFIGNEKEVSIKTALQNFNNFINYDCIIWGNGSEFDNTIVANAYRKAGMTLPWKYSNNRCFRTLKNLFPNVKKPANNDEGHNALSDAVWQAEYAINILNESGLKI